MPSLLAKVLFALKGGRRLRWLATDPMGIADVLSMLCRAESVLLLAADCVNASPDNSRSVGEDAESC